MKTPRLLSLLSAPQLRALRAAAEINVRTDRYEIGKRAGRTVQYLTLGILRDLGLVTCEAGSWSITTKGKEHLALLSAEVQP